MITQEQQMQGAELMKTLVEKAWESAAFKDYLVKKPVEAIESVTELQLKNDMNFIVEDQTDPSIIYLNLLSKPRTDDYEMSSEQLELVSGGGPIKDLFYWGTNEIIDGIQWVGDQFTR